MKDCKLESKCNLVEARKLDQILLGWKGRREPFACQNNIIFYCFVWIVFAQLPSNALQYHLYRQRSNFSSAFLRLILPSSMKNKHPLKTVPQKRKTLIPSPESGWLCFDSCDRNARGMPLKHWISHTGKLHGMFSAVFLITALEAPVLTLCSWPMLVLSSCLLHPITVGSSKSEKIKSWGRIHLHP